MDAPNPEHEPAVGLVSAIQFYSFMVGVHEEDQDGWKQNEYKVEGIPSQIDACVSDEIFDGLCDV